MAIYISKNNQQTGPFEDTTVLEMLKSGQLSPDNLAIRQGEKAWQKLSNYFPNAEIVLEQPAVRKSSKGLLLGCGSFLVITLLIAGVLGILAYRNLYPADSKENLPDIVNDFKLDKRNPPEGNIWGTQTECLGIYSNSSKTQTVIYRMIVYKDEATAKEAMQSDPYNACKITPGIKYSFVKNGLDVSQGKYCGTVFYIQNDNKFVIADHPRVTAETLVRFAENLPFNAGTTIIKNPNK